MPHFVEFGLEIFDFRVIRRGVVFCVAVFRQSLISCTKQAIVALRASVVIPDQSRAPLCDGGRRFVRSR